MIVASTPREQSLIDLLRVTIVMLDDLSKGYPWRELGTTLFSVKEQAVELGVLPPEEVEGWALFNVDGVYVLQRIDEAGVFESDDDAVLFVVARARNGSTRHMDALAKIGTAVPS